MKPIMKRPSSAVTVDSLIARATKGVDFRSTAKGIQDAIDAANMQAALLKETDYNVEIRCPKCNFQMRAPMTPKDLAQTMSYTVKAMDEVYRLSEFGEGRADSRPEVGVGGLLEFLEDWQVRQLDEWVTEGKVKRAKRINGEEEPCDA